MRQTEWWRGCSPQPRSSDLRITEFLKEPNENEELEVELVQGSPDAYTLDVSG